MMETYIREARVINIKMKELILEENSKGNYIYIGRGKCPVTGQTSKWKNPFIIGKDGTREEVIKKYEKYIRNKPELLKDLNKLKNKLLGCYCKPDYACHGDILIKLLKENDE